MLPYVDIQDSIHNVNTQVDIVHKPKVQGEGVEEGGC
jgi:hypothetical protein